MNYNNNSKYYLSLKAKICGLEHISKSIKRDANKKTGDARHAAKTAKRELGSITREHLIAYGLLKGRSYTLIETQCRTGNEPSVRRVQEIINQHVVPWSLDRHKWTEHHVRELLKREK